MLAGCSPEPRGHMPLVSFCSRLSPEHASDPSELQRLVANHFPPNSAAPIRGRANRAFSGQGSLGLLHRVDPHHDDRSPQWIYPNLTGPGTPCHDNVLCSSRKIEKLGDPAVVGLFRTISPRSTGLRPSILLEPPRTLARESLRT